MSFEYISLLTFSFLLLNTSNQLHYISIIQFFSTFLCIINIKNDLKCNGLLYYNQLIRFKFYMPNDLYSIVYRHVL